MSARGPSAAGRPVAARTRWYREPWVWLVVGIPGVAVVMGGVLLYLSTRGYDGLVADDYYKQGMQINRSLARDRAAASFGLVGELAVAGETVRVQLRGDEGFTTPPAVDLTLHHATRAGLDRTVRLGLVGVDSYSGDWSALEPGAWNLRLATEQWRLVGRIHAPGGVGVTLAPAPR